MPDDVTLHLGDCLAFLKTLPDASVDAVVTDPPYSSGIARFWLAVLAACVLTAFACCAMGCRVIVIPPP